jgi:hypothetical protein
VRFLIDEMTVSIIGKHDARSTPISSRHGAGVDSEMGRVEM